MRVVNLKQRTPEWLWWRSRGVTASEAAVVLGESPYKTIWRLWAEKRGVVREANLDDNPHVQRGIAFEDAARRQFEERHETLLLPVCGESEEHPVVRASFDGLTDEGYPVELKCPAEKNFAEISAKGREAEIFRLYLPQLQHQIYVSDADMGWLAFYWNGHLKEIDVGRDQALIDDLVQKSLDFWELVEKGREPKMDPDRDLFVPQGDLAGEWVWKAVQYRDAVGEIETIRHHIKELEAVVKTLEGWFTGQLGDFAQGEHAGVRVKRWLQKGTIDYKKALRELAPNVSEEDLEQFRRKASERSRVDLVGEGRQEVPEPEAIKQMPESMFF
ncbi:MAG: YqaJ viral recombinase family protein [Methylothermaceae bacterium]|nr:YqaJ viral recombinase family protein [Methylothermaceae bacterium]